MANYQKKEYVVNYGAGATNGKDFIMDKLQGLNKKPSKLQNILTVALRLSLIKGYDDKFKLFINDKSLKDTNIIKYVQLAFTAKAKPKWNPNFLHLLRKAKVKPNEITNKSLKEILTGQSKLREQESFSYPSVFTITGDALNDYDDLDSDADKKVDAEVNDNPKVELVPSDDEKTDLEPVIQTRKEPIVSRKRKAKTLDIGNIRKSERIAKKKRKSNNGRPIIGFNWITLREGEY